MRNQLFSLSLAALDQSDTATIDPAPMLDIVFILIIFLAFLIAISRAEPYSHEVAQSDFVEVDMWQVVTVRISAKGQVAIDGRQMPLESLRHFLGPTSPKVQIVADPKTEVVWLTGLMAELTVLGVDDISLSRER